MRLKTIETTKDDNLFSWLVSSVLRVSLSVHTKTRSNPALFSHNIHVTKNNLQTQYFWVIIKSFWGLSILPPILLFLI